MNTKKTKIFLMTLVLVLTLASIVKANDESNVPMGAETADVIRSETSNTSRYLPTMVPAIAGNLTELNITGVTQTRSWQGFFGNVSGTIILEDSSGFRFYDWTAAEPQGQVYASVNETITWTDVACAPLDTDAAFRASWTAFYGMLETDYDDLNRTYILNDHPEIYVGSTTIAENSCRSTYTFQNNESQTGNFPSLLLTSDDATTLIFTAILEDKTVDTRDSLVGYDGGLYDFQLLVAEDGRTDNNQDTTPYFFWVEIH